MAVMAAVSVALTSAATGRSSNALNGGVLTGCIDDSDCQKLGEGSKYACFLVRLRERRGPGVGPKALK